MNLFESIILGITQGATEFLPISSSAHILFAQKWLGQEPSVHLFIWLHVGSLLAVLFFYRKDILELFGGFWSLITKREQSLEGTLSVQLLVATLLTIPLALWVANLFENTQESLPFIGIGLLLTAALIIAAVYLPSKQKSIGWKQAIGLGLIQGLAVLPGISRSGLTIAAALLMGIEKKEAVRFSFLLSIPTILGAAVFSTASAGISFSLSLLISMLVSAVVGYLAIIWMIKLVEGKWIYFAPYCFFLGILLLAL